jgi:hypothetical protein
MSWCGPTNNPSYAAEMFRVEVDAASVDLIWFDPNPHAGHEGGERHALAEFLVHARAHETIRGILGASALDQIVAEVKKRLG